MPTLKTLGTNALKSIANLVLPGSGTLAGSIGGFLNQPTAGPQTASFDASKPVMNLGNTAPTLPKTTAAPVPATGTQVAPTAPVTQPNANIFTTPSGVQVDAKTGQPVNGGTTGTKSFNTGNPDLDSFLNNLPQVKQALGIGQETPEQKQAREAQMAGLQRLQALQESLIKSGAPSDVLANLDKTIKDTSDALKSTAPDSLLSSMPSFQGSGITQGALLRESAARADPIARTLSDLVSSRSIIAEQQQQEHNNLKDQISAIGNITDIQGALAKLTSPDSNLTDSMKNSLFSALVNRASQDPIDKQIKQAQLRKLNLDNANSSGNAGNSDEASYLADQVLSRSLPYQTLTADQKRSVTTALTQRGLAVPRKLTTKEIDAQGDAASALQAVDQIENLYNKDKSLLFKNELPGFLGRVAGASQFRNLVAEATDVKTRVRTGAALNDQEISFYAAQAPKIGDSDADVTTKLAQLRGLYLGASGLPVTVTNPQTGEAFTFQDLYVPQQRLGMRKAIDEGYTLDY